MPMLHDPAVRADYERRLQSLTANAERRWGKMTVDQMLWHVNTSLSSALGEIQLPPQKPAIPMPRALAKFMVLNLPWPKGSPTLRGLEAGERYDFEAEKRRCLELVKKFTDRSLAQPWPPHPVFGVVPGGQLSRLQAKHIDHHLRQFGS